MRKVYGGPLYTMGQDYMMMPGARLEVGPGGRLFETLGAAQAETAIQDKVKAEVAKAMAEPNEAVAAKRELARMKYSLKGWLKYRRMNDEIARGTRKARIPAFLAQATLDRDRDYAGEQKLATDLHLLLSRVYHVAKLPLPDVKANKNAAVQLANIAIAGKLEEATPTPQGILPIVILAVGGVALFTATSYISNRAEVQKEQERLKCIQSGGCTDYGFWLKAASVVVIGYFVWEKLGVGERVKGLIKGRK